MSRIKYYIFVFCVVISALGNPQNFEGDNLLEKNRIKVFIHNAEQEEGRGHYFDAIKSLQQALTIAEEVNLKKEQGVIFFPFSV